MNMPLVLLNRRRRGGPAAFSPTRLFALAEPGVWYDPSDLTTLFTDTAGTTPVTTPGQTVALALDKSKGLVLGSERVTNGNFSNGTTGWVFDANWNLSSGSAVSNGASGDLYQSGFTANVTYRVTFTVTAYTSGNLAVRGGAGFQAYGVGTHTLFFRDVGGLLVFQSANYNGTIDNISVRELPGFHATQATAASRPTYGIVPLGGRRNLLTRTEEFNDAVWTKVNVTITANAGTAPDGTTTAEAAFETTTNAAHSVYSDTYNVTTGQVFTKSVYVKANGRTKFAMQFENRFGSTPTCLYDLVAVTATPTEGTATISSAGPVGSGWFRCTFTDTATSTGSDRFYINLANDAGAASYAGDVTKGILIWGAQLETGSSATAYQRVGSAFDVTEAGVASLSYLSFDGIDDHLVTPTITPGVDKAQVFAGVRKLSDANAGAIIGSSSDINTNGGAFEVSNYNGTGGVLNFYCFRSKGTVDPGVVFANGYAAPITNVITGLGDISGDRSTLRVNGTQVAQSTADQGTGNYLAYPLYIGRRGGTTLGFNGFLFGLIVRFGTNLDAGTITSTETWVNQRTGAF